MILAQKRIMQNSSVLLIFLAFYFNAYSQNKAYSFFIAGHSYGEVGGMNRGLHPALVKKFEKLNSLNDMQMGFLLGDAVRRPIADEFDDIERDLSKLDFQVYIVAGNHENKDCYYFEERYGPTYYSFKFNNDLFIILNPCLDAWNIYGPQLIFLKETLDENAKTSDNIFVLFHQLLWIEADNNYAKVAPNSFEDKDPPINFWPEVMPLFTVLENNVVFCAGDLGALDYCYNIMYDKFDNITFLASGMGDGDRDNIIIVKIGEDKKLSFEVVCLNTETENCFGDIEKHEITKE
jgi:hypothetical protein